MNTMFSEYFKQWWVEFSKGELSDEKTDKNISKLLKKIDLMILNPYTYWE